MRSPRRRRKKRGVAAQLKMTSLMDILVVLLLFLLKSFVVEGDIVTPAQGVELPQSTSEEPPEESLVIAVSGESVRVGGDVVAALDQVTAPDDLLIAPLAERLEAVRAQKEHLREAAGGGEPAGGIVTVQADRRTEFRVLQRVMYTLNRAGFENLSLAVLQES